MGRAYFLVEHIISGPIKAVDKYSGHIWLENQVFLFPIYTHYQIQAYTLQAVNAAYVYNRNLLHLIILIV